MKKLLLILPVFLISSTVCFAAKWRVNNNTGVSANFTTLQAAHDAAAAGDTIYVEGSAIDYGALITSKQLYWYGPGYFLAENDSTQANLSTAFTTYFVSVNAGSEGSLFTGLAFTSGITIYAGNVVFKRNYVYGTYGVRVLNSASNVMIIQNYIYCTYSGSSYHPVQIGTGSSNIFVQNNYLGRFSTTYDYIYITGTAAAQVSNNVIRGNINSVNSTFTNNILTTGTVSGTGNSYFNNLCDGTQFPTGNGNQQNVNMLTVFDSTSTSTDGRWQLIAGSPAIGAGISGEDCGMFGGIDPYILSGLPSIPSIFFFNAPSSGSAATGLPVNIKIKSNN